MYTRAERRARSGDGDSGAGSDNLWRTDTKRATVFVLQGERDKRFRAYLMRDNDMVGRIEGPLALYDGFVEDMNKLWSSSGALGSFVWQSRRMRRLPKEPPPAERGKRSLVSLVLERNADRVHDVVEQTFALFIEIACKKTP